MDFFHMEIQNTSRQVKTEVQYVNKEGVLTALAGLKFSTAQ